MPATLRFGDKGPDVATLVDLLTRCGCAPVPPVTASPPKYGRAIENMVLYFQMTHQGPNGAWLDPDGVVGPATWWALEHATGASQRSFLEVGIPGGITGHRRAILETAVREHGVREAPGRPNRGDEVDKYLPGWITASRGNAGQPWCAYFASWVLKQVYGRHLLGSPVASVWSAYTHAVEHRRWEPNDGRTPTPGDAFVILHGDDYRRKRCTGHIGFVLQVATDGRSFNTVEGNCGDRVKVGRRLMADPKLRGFINIVGDRPAFTRGSLRGAPNVGGSGTR